MLNGSGLDCLRKVLRLQRPPRRLPSQVIVKWKTSERTRASDIERMWSPCHGQFFGWERSKGGLCIIRRQCEDVTSDRVRVRVDVGKVRLSRSRRIGDVEQAQFRTLPQKLPTACN